MSTRKLTENLLPIGGKTAASQKTKTRVTLDTQTKAPDNWWNKSNKEPLTRWRNEGGEESERDNPLG